MICFLTLVLCAIVCAASKPAKVCSRTLQNIIFQPNSCALKYFQSMEAQFFAFGAKPALFTLEKDNFVFSFENLFDISVSLIDAMGGATTYFKDGTSVAAPSVKYSNIAQNYLNKFGFVRQISDRRFYYTFPVHSEDGEYYNVTFEMSIENDPIFC